MWNENAPLELLKELPAKLSEENLSEIQKVIDADKYENSKIYGRDLCGEYAPFCETCVKSAGYPCATAYVRMKQAEGLEVSLARDEEQPEEVLEEEYCEPQCAEQCEPQSEEKSVRRIRIAIAKRRR